MTNTRDLLIRKYIIDIVFVVVVISLLTWFWFGPYQHKVRIRESLMANNIEFNKEFYKHFVKIFIKQPYFFLILFLFLRKRQ